MEILKDKSLRHYDKLSRYTNIPFYYHSIDDKYVYGMASSLKKDCPYTTYKIKSGDTLDSLALKFYNKPTYYWILADFNNILDSFSKLRVGAMIKVPTLSELDFE